MDNIQGKISVNIRAMIERLIKKKYIIICGHYGTGKTNISVNLAINIKNAANIAYTVVDLDIVNPYFRSADNIGDLREHGIDCIIPQFANTNIDIPAVSPEVYSIFRDDKRAVIDVGGDDTGATALGMFSSKINKIGDNSEYEMIYVINKYRALISDIEQVKNLADFIEKKSKLRISSLINNSNAGEMTTEDYILNSFDYADKAADIIGVPLIGTSVTGKIAERIPDNLKEKYKIFEIKDYTKKYF